ncbi:hypothetical protein L914_15211 [Phytophthora nicotianae]|uniref:MULE transposase domain-containing protein n=1 Tax=Phytophthora nicotianae TaxID=4792 RepID=W2MQE4_PHYNI|nr:hypothetical protein L914_15211 [Phytophthora nicotianae]
MDSNVDIKVGGGINANAFFVGFTTKTLLKRLDRDPRSFIFHFDAKYKLNQVDYPIFVCGISDHACSFYLVALYVVSKQEECDYTSALASLRAVYARVFQKPMEVYYILGDADGAQINAMV